MIKLIVGDLDGTLLDDEGRLDSDLIEITQKLREKGILFSLASGRNHAIMQDFVECLNIEIPYMSDNGANVYQKAECLKSYYFDVNYNNYLLETLAKENLPFNAYSTKAGYFNLTSPKLDKVRSRLGDKIVHETFKLKDYSTEQFYKITIDSIYHEQMETIVNEIDNHCPNIYLRKAEGTFYSITAKGVDKGKACLELGSLLNIKPEEMMSLGDNNNDVSMFKITGESVCVSNAKEEIKKQAKHICGSNNEHGPTIFLREYFNL